MDDVFISHFLTHLLVCAFHFSNGNLFNIQIYICNISFFYIVIKWSWAQAKINVKRKIHYTASLPAAGVRSATIILSPYRDISFVLSSHIFL